MSSWWTTGEHAVQQGPLEADGGEEKIRRLHCSERFPTPHIESHPRKVDIPANLLWRKISRRFGAGSCCSATALKVPYDWGILVGETLPKLVGKPPVGGGRSSWPQPGEKFWGRKGRREARRRPGGLRQKKAARSNCLQTC